MTGRLNLQLGKDFRERLSVALQERGLSMTIKVEGEPGRFQLPPPTDEEITELFTRILEGDGSVIPLPHPLTPEELRAFRKEYGLTQKDLASRLGVHQRTVSNWEMRVAKPAHMVRLALAQLAKEMK